MVTGIAQLIDKLNGIKHSVVSGGGDALFEIGKEIMEVAKERVPYFTGTLHDSGTVHPPELYHDKAIVTLSFGGDARAYAIPVHEDLNMRHHNGGQAKFLESAIQESAPYVGEKIAYRMMQIWWKE